MPETASCAGCGAPFRRKEGAWCPRCRQEQQKAPCSGCGNSRLLLPGTGRCATCSRTCADCGKVVRPRGRDRCSRCHRRAEPSRTCRACGKLAVIVAHGLCDNCWQQDPGQLAGQVEHLVTRLGDPPAWLADFAAHAAARHCTGRTSLMISRLGRILAEAGTATPQAILEKAAGRAGQQGLWPAPWKTSSPTPGSRSRWIMQAAGKPHGASAGLSRAPIRCARRWNATPPR